MMLLTEEAITKEDVEIDGAYFVGDCVGTCRGAWVFADTTYNRGRWVQTYINFDQVLYVRHDLVEMRNGESFYLHPKSLEYFRMHTGFALLKDLDEVV